MRLILPSKYLYTLGLLAIAAFLFFGQYWILHSQYFFHSQNLAAVNYQHLDQPDRLIISKINLDAPILYADTVDENQFQKFLEQGVVHYPDTALPGQPGNCYIFGHSSDYAWTPGNYKSVFALLTNLTIGDAIIVSNHQGQTFDYVVTTKFVVESADKSVLNQDLSKHLLTLQTSYPLGTALKRYIVQAELK